MHVQLTQYVCGRTDAVHGVQGDLGHHGSHSAAFLSGRV